jgi:DNA-binding GntR family transcriptional regulator
VTDILKPDELHQMFDVRYVLEVHALTSAEMSSEAVGVIASLVERMLASGDGTVYDDYREFMALDHQFHRALVELANNSFLVDAWEDLHVHLHLSRLYTGVGLFDRGDSIKEHDAILSALRQENKKLAVSLLGQHIERVEKRMQLFLEK